MTAGRAVPVLLDKERRLRYQFNGLCDVERVLGKTLMETVSTSMGFYEIRGLLWCGLVHEDPALTVPGVGDLVQGYLEAGGRVDQLVDTMRQALEVSGLLAPPPAGAKADTDRPLVSGHSSTSASDSPSAGSASSPGSSSG